ncbi:hypothetical protein EVAR_84391_1 [Eumeta japonica]|uniref:Uncharacterized protein n=1 Tax=Eumeta variegata TaxID=151549 RepID=A0A4C1YI73_EUMVA|nr:hypothetical protein EVAR_84391_1 [Eumeta japonica]
MNDRLSRSEINTSPCRIGSTSNSPPSLLQDAALPALLVSGASTLFQNNLTTSAASAGLSLPTVDSLCLPGSEAVGAGELAGGCASGGALGGLALPLTTAGLCSTSSASAVAWLMNEDSAGEVRIKVLYIRAYTKRVESRGESSRHDGVMPFAVPAFESLYQGSLSIGSCGVKSEVRSPGVCDGETAASAGGAAGATTEPLYCHADLPYDHTLSYNYY